MSSLSISWDIRDLISAKNRMSLQERLPEFIAKTMTVSLRDLAEPNARDKRRLPSRIRASFS